MLKRTLREKFTYSEFLWPVFSAFGLNTGRYGVSFLIQLKCRKIRSRKTPNWETLHGVEVFFCIEFIETAAL